MGWTFLLQADSFIHSPISYTYTFSPKLNLWLVECINDSGEDRMAGMGNRTSSTCLLEKGGSKQAIFLRFSWLLERMRVGGRWQILKRKALLQAMVSHHCHGGHEGMCLGCFFIYFLLFRLLFKFTLHLRCPFWWLWNTMKVRWVICIFRGKLYLLGLHNLGCMEDGNKNFLSLKLGKFYSKPSLWTSILNKYCKAYKKIELA